MPTRYRVGTRRPVHRPTWRLRRDTVHRRIHATGSGRSARIRCTPACPGTRLPIPIFARQGDERSAARAIKAGAVDYWPIHSVDLAELAATLQPFLNPQRSAPAKPRPADQGLPDVAGYRMLKRIAHSSAATVYLARNDDLAQSVALKVQTIRGQASVSEEDRQRFARECEILSSLNHRSIADVIDFGITPEYLYLALEYFPCGSMRERLKNPVSEVDALNYARQIGEALQVVHAAGIVHRDSEALELMLTSDNRVVLIDFGSARAQLVAHDLSRSDLMTGTPYYVCPEQISGNKTDQRGDLYSLGVIFYEMLAGMLPFRGNTLADIFEGHRTAPVPPLPVTRAALRAADQSPAGKKPARTALPRAAQFLEAFDGVGAARPKEPRLPEYGHFEAPGAPRPRLRPGSQFAGSRRDCRRPGRSASHKM